MRGCGGLSSGDDEPAGRTAAPRRARRTVHRASTTRSPPVIVPASVRLGTGTGDDGDPRLHDAAAHSLPDGAGAAAVVTIVADAAARVGWESIEPGTRQLTATAARVIKNPPHLDATI